MEEKEQLELLRKYHHAVRALFETDDGKVVLEVLKQNFVDTSVLSPTSEETHYRLGQKELIQQLIMEAGSALPTLEDDLHE